MLFGALDTGRVIGPGRGIAELEHLRPRRVDGGGLLGECQHAHGAGVGIELHALQQRLHVIERLRSEMTELARGEPDMAEDVVAAFMRHEEMRIGALVGEHRRVDDDRRAPRGIVCRGGLLREVANDVGGDGAIGVVHRGELAAELEAAAGTARRGGDLPAPGLESRPPKPRPSPPTTRQPGALRCRQGAGPRARGSGRSWALLLQASQGHGLGRAYMSDF